MNGFLFFLYCMEILGALLCGAQTILSSSAAVSGNGTDRNESNYPTTAPITVPPRASSSLAGRQTPTAVSPRTSPSPGPHPIIPSEIFYRKEFRPVLMVTGGLIIACTFLLLSTLLLAWKVCQLSQRIKALSSSTDLISNSEYWMGTAKKNKNKPETEPKETSVLIADISQTEQEMGNGATEEEGGKVNEEGQTGEEDKTEAGDTPKSEEAVENSSSSKPQEEAADSQPTKAVAASTPESAEETKVVV